MPRCRRLDCPEWMHIITGMITRIRDKLYCLPIPLPGSPLKAINAYVIPARPRALIVDTGLDRDVCVKAFYEGLSTLNLNPQDCDFFLTHFHADHTGLLARLDLRESNVYMSAADADNYQNTRYWTSVADAAAKNGFPEDKIQQAITDHPGYKYRRPSSLDFEPVRQGSLLRIGGFEFVCLETPGHTSGHVCLYEETRGILLAGDLILDRITPIIQTWRLDDNPLGDYLASLEKISTLKIATLLPGHGVPVKNAKTRIDEIRKHHDDRSQEIARNLLEKEMSAYEIDSKLTWHAAWPDWERFPLWHRLLATGETLAHLCYLSYQHTVKYHQDGEHYLFQLSA